MAGGDDRDDGELRDGDVSTFGWRETRDRLDRLLREVRLERDLRTYCGDTQSHHITFRPPLAVARAIDAAETADDFLRDFDDTLGRQAIVLLRAGAAALGVWDDDSLTLHKVFKRYVVRGNGRAQSTHLATKGKSRDGSRLRLQNAKRLLEETRDRLAQWDGERAFDTVFVACPIRLWSEFERQPGGLPFAGERIVRIPFHTHEPGHKEILRVRRLLCRGRVTRRPRP